MWLETQWQRYVDWEAIGDVFIKETVDGWLVIARVGKGYITLGKYFCEERAEEVWEMLKRKRRSSPRMVRMPKK